MSETPETQGKVADTTKRDGKKRSPGNRGRAMRMAHTHQLDAYMQYGVFPAERKIQYPTPPDPVHEDGDVNRGGARYFINGITYLRMCYPDDEITVQLSTPGGCDYAMFAVYDAIRDVRYKNPITIEVYGLAMSAGVFILQAGTRRIVRRHARLMVHYGSWGGVELHSKDFDRAAKENEVCREIYKNVLWARIKEKHPEFTDEEMDKILRFDTYMSAQEAVDMGLADEIM